MRLQPALYVPVRNPTSLAHQVYEWPDATGAPNVPLQIYGYPDGAYGGLWPAPTITGMWMLHAMRAASMNTDIYLSC